MALGIPSVFVIKLCSKLYILTVLIRVNSLSNNVTFNSLYLQLFQSQRCKPKSTVNKWRFYRLHRHAATENKFHEKVNAEAVV
jgi:hypothetical protein